MKGLIYFHRIHLLKMLLVSTVAYTTIVNYTDNKMWAKSPPQKVPTIVQKLKKSDQRWIQIDLSQQNLIAWEGKKLVYKATISSGKPSTPTRIGIFKIQSKFKKTRMRGRGYDIANVPYAMYYQGGYAIHGAYWHKKFGTPISHGCVNLTPNKAKWLFNWANVGTTVVIQK
ncbi:L,D-transpeptidase [Dolichospermum circinale CS-537/03]|nr:L,D-transpeptidase [Dolichospermum circinale]MDB9473445.1 L,D-transpeptidase [Dolichospermum circinale CS-537/11]MDB9480602.1 L,D-transpeptidase [Dolichospermum circinale CS-537/03]MDB9483481.1 L,D-transpeptidase [Dolichospermum circinale CS-537/05]